MPWIKFLLLALLVLGPALPTRAQPGTQTAEYQLINLINRYRRTMHMPTLQFDVPASEVARQHSQEMLKDNFFSLESPQHGSLEYQLTYARISGHPQHTFIALDYGVPNIFSQLQQNPALLSPEVTHAAVGIASGQHPKYGSAMWATVILLQYMAQLEFVPRTAQPGQVLRLQATLAPGYINPRLPVTVPYGQVLTFYPTRYQGARVWFEVPLRQGKGRYTLELLLDKPGQGPRVATILPLYVGVGYPLKEPAQNNETAPNFANTDEAAQYLLQRVNQARQKYGLRSLESDPLLTYVAWHHSADMARRKFFAHVNPDGEDPNARFRRQGGHGMVGENIAYDSSIEAAHNRLMNSPGHRANILQDDYTHIGVGVYFDGGHYYVTQLFQRRSREVAGKQRLSWKGYSALNL
ncbi:MAG: CAP domain-containing protein [Candidatus Sericytochromatia bacterium]